MKSEPITKAVYTNAHRSATILSPKAAIDNTEFQPILDKELDRLNENGSVYNISNPKIVLAGILGVINGAKSMVDDNPRFEEGIKAFGFDKIQRLIEEALQESVIKTGRGQIR